MQKSEQLLIQIYQEFYHQKSVLPEAPPLTLTEDEQKSDNFNYTKAKLEVEAIVAYLLGLKNISDKNWDELFQLVNQYYQQQPEWQKILLDFLGFQLALDKENNQKLQADLLAEIQKLLKK